MRLPWFLGGFVVLGSLAEWLFKETVASVFYESLKKYTEALVGQRVGELIATLTTNAVPLTVVAILGGYMMMRGSGLAGSQITRNEGFIPPEKRHADRVKTWMSCWEAAEKFADKDALEKYAECARLRRESEAEYRTTAEVINERKKTAPKHFPSPMTEAPDPELYSLRTLQSEQATEMANRQSNQNMARQTIEWQLWGKLAEGSIIARGFIGLIPGQDAQVILASQWTLLRINISKEEAEGDGLIFKGVQIGKPRKWF